MSNSPRIKASRLRTTGASVDIDGAAPPLVGQSLTAIAPDEAEWQYPTATAGWTSMGGGHTGEKVLAAIAAPSDDFLYTIGASRITRYRRSTMEKLQEASLSASLAGSSVVGHNQFVRVNDDYLYVACGGGGGGITIRRYALNDLNSVNVLTISTTDIIKGFQIGEGLGGVAFQDQLFVLTASATQSTIRVYNKTTFTFSTDIVLKDASLVDFPVDVFGLDIFYTGVGNTVGQFLVGTKRDSGNGLSATIFTNLGVEDVSTYFPAITSTANGDGGLPDTHFLLYNKNYNGDDLQILFQSNDVRALAWTNVATLSPGGAHRRNTSNPMRVYGFVHGGMLGSTPDDWSKLAVFGIVHPSATLTGSSICRMTFTPTPGFATNFTEINASFQAIPGADDIQAMCVGPDGALYVYIGMDGLNTTQILDNADSNLGGWRRIVNLI